MPPTQKHRLIAIGTALGDDAPLITSFSMTEELGRLFHIEVELASQDPALDFDKIVGTNATLRLELQDGKTRYFNGYISRFVQAGEQGDYARYRATLVPWLWFLTRTSDCRIFPKKKVPDIIEDVFKGHGFKDYKLRLSGSYPEWEYCVQYRETDFNFVSRLMEQEGIYYYFTHEDGKHTLVLADAPGSHDPFPDYDSLHFRPPAQDSGDETEETITEWVIQKEVQPGVYAVADFNFKTPATPIVVNANVNRTHEASHFEVYDYPGEFDDRDSGEAYAKIRIQEFQAAHEVLHGRSSARGIATGCKFTLKDHPREDQNREYLITAASYHAGASEYQTSAQARDEEFFSCTLTAIPTSQNYRSLRTTPKPLIQGPQTAIVVGKSGEEIDTDEFGRVRVQFHWDRYGKADQDSSCLVRVSQNVAGKGWGAISIPRIGQEVIVEFLEGDPDQPIITGRVYNATAKVPYALPDNKTISTFKSNSSKGGGGFNELRFEDNKDSEKVFLHAQKDLDTRVKNDAKEWIGNDRHLIVSKKQLEHVKGDRGETVDGCHKEAVGKDRHLKVTGKQAVEIGGNYSLTVKGDMVDVFKANHSEQTTQNYYLKAMGIVLEGSTGITLKCGGNSVVIDAAGVTIKGSLVTVDGSMVKIASGPGSPPTSGSAGTADAPQAPDDAKEAATGDPGAKDEPIERQPRQGSAGSWSSSQVSPYEQEQKTEEGKTWVEFQLLGADEQPVKDEKYKLHLPDGSTKEGKTDGNGMIRLDNIESGDVRVEFPDRHSDEWGHLRIE